jgi:hypothetical protein
MKPSCPICGGEMSQLLFNDGTPDNLWECPRHCHSGPDQAVRVRTEEKVRSS